MQLYERLNALVETLSGGNVTAFCRKLSIRNTTFSNYLTESGQQAMRLHQLHEVLESYPQVNRDWLFFDEGEMFAPGFRMGMRMGERLPMQCDEDDAPKVETPVADKVRDAEIGLRKAGASEIMVWHVVADLADQKVGMEKSFKPAAPMAQEPKPDESR